MALNSSTLDAFVLNFGHIWTQSLATKAPENIRAKWNPLSSIHIRPYPTVSDLAPEQSGAKKITNRSPAQSSRFKISCVWFHKFCIKQR